MTLPIDDLRSIVRQPGFIHTLSVIIANESLFTSDEAVRSRNRFELISFNEVSVLLSLLSEVAVDLSTPSPPEIQKQYSQCKAALEQLHRNISSLSIPKNLNELFSEGRHFIEPIFYAASSAYWFDYLDMAPQLYELDQQFLKERGFHIEEFAALLRRMHDIFRRRFRDFIRSERKKMKRGLPMSSPLLCFLFSQEDFDAEMAPMFVLFTERFSVKPGEMPTMRDPLAGDCALEWTKRVC